MDMLKFKSQTHFYGSLCCFMSFLTILPMRSEDDEVFLAIVRLTEIPDDSFQFRLISQVKFQFKFGFRIKTLNFKFSKLIKLRHTLLEVYLHFVVAGPALSL